MNSTSTAPTIILQALQGHDPITYSALQVWMAYRLERLELAWWMLWVGTLLTVCIIGYRAYRSQQA